MKGVCAASDFKTWLEVAYLYLTEPRKDKDIFNAIIGRQRSLLQNRDANPNVAYNDSLRTTLYGDSKRINPVTVDNLDEVDFDRIYEIYNERFKDLSGMNLIVTGDIREDEFEDLICTYIASLPGKRKKSQTLMVGPNTLSLRQGTHKIIFKKNLKTPSSFTNIIFNSDRPYTAANNLRLDVLCQIMRGIFTETIREEKGGTYGVSVDGQFWRYPTDGCSMTISFRCSPDNYDELIGTIDEQIIKMAETGPTQEQLDRVMAYECKNYERALLTNGWWEYIRFHELRDGIDFNKDYLENLRNLTADDIRNFCEELIDSGNRIEVTMQPL